MPIDHHDLTRLLAFGRGQKIIVSGISMKKSNTELLPHDNSIIRHSVYYEMSFKPFSRVKLPLDDFGRSRLNLLPGKSSLVDGTSEYFVDFNHSKKWEIGTRVNLTTTIKGRLEICSLKLLDFSLYTCVTIQGF